MCTSCCPPYQYPSLDDGQFRPDTYGAAHTTSPDFDQFRVQLDVVVLGEGWLTRTSLSPISGIGTSTIAYSLAFSYLLWTEEGRLAHRRLWNRLTHLSAFIVEGRLGRVDASCDHILAMEINQVQ